MTESKSLDVEKKELEPQENTERTRECRCYIPRTDIYENDEAVFVTCEMPGVDDKTIEVTLEKDILTIKGFVEPDEMKNSSLLHAEYGIGDFQRKFTISNEIDRNGIDATIKDGLLKLRLPKLGPAKAQKISVRSND